MTVEMTLIQSNIALKGGVGVKVGCKAACRGIKEQVKAAITAHHVFKTMDAYKGTSRVIS